jgi:transcriptional regulator with XRE-family HTH domain
LPQRRLKYDVASVALRVLRIVAVASIFAFVLTARTVMPTHANTDDRAADPSPAHVDSSPTDVGEEPPPPDPPPPEPAPVAAEPPPPDTVEAVVSPTDPTVAAEPPPEDPGEPALADPAESDSTVSPVLDSTTTIADPADSHPSAAEPAPPVPSTHRSPEPVPPVADNPGQAATAPVTAIVSALAKPTDGRSDVQAHTSGLPSAVAAGAGLAAVVVTSQAPSSVAVAIEFGRAGGGWAGAIVFNLWLRRQMRERRMSQRQLAALAGVDHSTVSRLLRHDRGPSLTTATKLVGALRQVRGEQAEPDTADYFERNPEETVFPARRVESALRADELLDDEQVRRLMNIYLDARRRHQAGTSPSAPTRARPARAAPDPRR